MAQSRTTVRALLLTLLALGAAFSMYAPDLTPKASAQTNSPIAATALKYVGTHGGQCWTFMKNVVREATGYEIGFDYRLGYLQAGAIEVSREEATNGDIIQIASDRNTSPWASYPGLHTAIILENLGGGVFNAVDSNQNWDEWVRLRPNYNPYASAARYGLDVHIYRIPGGSTKPVPASSAPAVAADTRAWAAGSTAVVSTDSGCLNLRTAGQLGASIIDCLPKGTAVTVVGGPVTATGHTWVKVTTPKGTGWVATGYLTQSAAPSSSAAAPPPAATTAPVATPTTAPAAAQGVLKKTDNSAGCLRLRSTSGLGGSILDCLPAATSVRLVPGTDPVVKDGYTWVLVEPPGRARGWVASEFLVN